VAVVFDVVLHINAENRYKVCLTSEDGSRLFIVSVLVVWDGGLRPPKTQVQNMQTK
jgi:hypothetical protein